MCLSPPTPKIPDPVAPLAPLEIPKPMGLADSVAGKRSVGGVSQLRIGSKSINPGNGAAAGAAMTIQGRKAEMDRQIAAAGG